MLKGTTQDELYSNIENNASLFVNLCDELDARIAELEAENAALREELDIIKSMENKE